MIPRAPSAYLSLAAIAVFVICLVFAASRLVETERALDRDVGENIVWLASQTQFEALRFADAAARFAAGDEAVPVGELQKRFDVLASRFQVLLEGEVQRYLADLGLAPDVEHAAGALIALEFNFQDLKPGDRAAAQAIRAAAEPIAMRLRQVTNLAMIGDRDRALALRDHRQRTVLEILGYVLGIMASGAFLSVSLMLGLRRSARAEVELARHRDHLEELVDERTADLQRTEHRLIAAINTAPDGFAAFGPDDRLVLANTRISNLMADFDGLLEPGSQLANVTNAFRRLGAHGLFENTTTWEGELRLSPVIWVQITMRRTPDGGTLLRMADITRYKDATAALESALNQERNLNEVYRSFVSMVSHQFRTPLAVIDASAQRMLRRAAAMTAEEIAHRVEKIRTATLRLVSLMDSTLSAARLDAGEMALEARACELQLLIYEACDRQREIAPGREFCIDSTGLTVDVWCDPILIEQVLSNLLSNAVKYSPEGSPIEVCAWAETTDVLISVRDQGIGIPADEIPRLFGRFFRARTAVGIAGTGIGLSFAHQIVQMHDGSIAVESQVGEGSIFTVRLPGAACIRERLIA